MENLNGKEGQIWQWNLEIRQTETSPWLREEEVIDSTDTGEGSVPFLGKSTAGDSG
jgi:hypothetical protein